MGRATGLRADRTRTEGFRLTLAPSLWSSIESWARTDGRLSPRTVDKFLRYLRFLETQGLELDPFVASREATVSLLARALEGGRAPQTLNLWVTAVNRWIRWIEWVRRSERRPPRWDRVPPFRHHHLADVPAPSRAEAQRLWELTWRDPATSARNRAIFAVLLDKGLRRQELIDLNRTDLVHGSKGPALLVRRGKGEKERSVPIHAESASRIRIYLDLYRNPSDPSALFTTPRGRISHAYLGKIVKEAGARVGVPWISPHKLRHFATDDMLDRGVRIESAAYILGHEDVETTMRYRSQRLRRALAEEEVRSADRGRFRPEWVAKAPPDEPLPEKENEDTT